MSEPRDDRAILPRAWSESDRFVPRAFVQPALRFMRIEAASGIVMLLAALAALVWANSGASDSYFTLFGAKIELSFGGFEFHHLSELTVQEWINDAAMVVFFFVVGLEIKRELVAGELRDPKAAALPVVAALGGMIAPAVIYLIFNHGTEASHGWGIPMATDIAFAVGVVSMVGRRVPIGAKLFLLALAIADDLGAILVIAIFYTEELAFGWLVAAAAGLAIVYLMQRAGIRHVLPYAGVGILVWLAMLESGVHATIAGVALAMLTPVHSHYDVRRFSERAGALVDRVGTYLPDSEHLIDADHHTIERVSTVLYDLKRLSVETLSPLNRLEQALSPWTSYVVVPVFALANAGVAISLSEIGTLARDHVTLGVGLGLLLGKLIGVFGASFLAIKIGLGKLPAHTTWTHMVGLGLLAGIGFTVALFVSALSFEEPDFAAASKVGIFAASAVAGIAGYLWMRFVTPTPASESAGRDEHLLDPATSTAG